jgi:hypothetical protein
MWQLAKHLEDAFQAAAARQTDQEEGTAATGRCSAAVNLLA